MVSTNKQFLKLLPLALRKNALHPHGHLLLISRTSRGERTYRRALVPCNVTVTPARILVVY